MSDQDKRAADAMYMTLAKKLIGRIIEADAKCDPPYDIELRLVSIIEERNQLRASQPPNDVLEALEHALKVFKSMANRGRYPIELLPTFNGENNPHYLGKQGWEFLTRAIELAKQSSEPRSVNSEMLALCIQIRDWLKPELTKEPDRSFFWKLVDVINKAKPAVETECGNCDFQANPCKNIHGVCSRHGGTPHSETTGDAP